MERQSKILMYSTEDGVTKVEVTFDDDTVWLSIDQMAELFQRDKSTISRHIKNIFLEGELSKNSVVANFATTASDGKTYQVDYYNLDVIISVGYRVKSLRGTQFRIWASGVLKEYMQKGFALDDDRLKRLGGGNYFDELLARIRDIRSSEKVFWRKVLEILRRFFTVPEGIETIVLHIASIVTVNPDFNQKVMDVNVGGTENIIQLCLEHKECKKLVYCSSTGAIPELPKGQNISEVDSFDADKVVGCYSQSKALATQAVLDAVCDKGLHACVVHPSGILGPEDFAVGETTGIVIQIINGEMPMGIDGSFNLCDVRDLANGTILAADKGKDGSYYILGNKEVSFKKFSKLLMEESGCKPIKFFLPIGMANFLAGILEKQAKKKGTRPLMTTFSVYNLARNNVFDSSKAERELGYKTRSYKETIRDEVMWLKANGKIA